MFTINPFAELSASVAPGVMQVYVVLMILAVVGGTLYDVMHKKSAKYFFDNWRKVKDKGGQDVGVAGLAVQTVAVDVLTSAEFCNPSRRIAHLLTMYGFIAYALATAVMVFGYPTATAGTPAIWPVLWHLGAISICIGGYWFWFFIRVDVASEGNNALRLIHADLFVLSLLASVTFALIWSYAQWSYSTWTNMFLALYLIASTVLFGSVPWSKFAHMFFKPAAALQKRVETANGTRRNLPSPADKPELLGSARRQPRHY